MGRESRIDHLPAIVGTGSYVPVRRVSSATVEINLGLNSGWIGERTGVFERRVASEAEATSDLATVAAERALAAAGVSAAEIDQIIVATSTPDCPLPSTACLVQANLGASSAAAFDVDAVCSGFVYALDISQKMMRGNSDLQHALIIGADVYSRILDYTDRRTSVLFGDGAGAVVLSRSGAGASVIYSKLGSDGTLAGYVGIRGGGSRSPLTSEGIAKGEHLFRMDGRAVRDFVTSRLPYIVHETLRTHDLTVSDIDLFVPHQANARLLEEVGEQLGFKPDQIAMTAGHFGNTGAASIPITLDEAVRQGRLDNGGDVMLAGFGGGMTWGTALLQWPAAPRGR